MLLTGLILVNLYNYVLFYVASLVARESCFFRSHGGRGPYPPPWGGPRPPSAAALAPRAGGAAFLVNGCEQPWFRSYARPALLRIAKSCQASARDRSRRPRPVQGLGLREPGPPPCGRRAKTSHLTKLISVWLSVPEPFLALDCADPAGREARQPRRWPCRFAKACFRLGRRCPKSTGKQNHAPA